MSNLLEPRVNSVALDIEKIDEGEYLLTLEHWGWENDITVELSVKDLINIEGKVHALIMQHEMGDSYDEPKACK